MQQHPLLKFSTEVSHAINNHLPIVALESTIISHGMPWPNNLETARAVEAIIRQNGAVPATIALHDGRVLIGLEPKEMELIAKSEQIIKASRRDLAYVITQKITASTTVAATMHCAHMAGLTVFVTGGIGGVHREVTETFDISADLVELSNTPIAVICSGAKSILDLPKTLEVLETYGVPVIGYQTMEFPAFFSHSSGIPLQHRLDSCEEIATLIQNQRQLGLKNGLIIANPIPKEAEIPDHEISPMINQAHKDAGSIQGKAITPFLLKRISELTTGRSLEANITLIKNNALLGAQIAAACHHKHVQC